MLDGQIIEKAWEVLTCAPNLAGVDAVASHVLAHCQDPSWTDVDVSLVLAAYYALRELQAEFN